MTNERTTTWEERIERIRDERAAVAAFDRDRPTVPGRLTPRQRLEALLDEGSFLEVGAFSHSQHEQVGDRTPSDGVITGYGTIAGREVCVVSEDPIALEITDAQVGKAKRSRLLDQAVYKGLPVVHLFDGSPTPYKVFPPGTGLLHARMAEQRSARDIGERTAPFVAVVFGHCHGQEAALAVESDVLVATPSGRVRLAEGLGADVAPDVAAADDAEAIAVAQRFLSLIPEEASSRLTPVVAAAAPVAPFDDTEVGVGPRRLLDGVFDAGSTVVFADPDAPGVLAGVGAVDGLPVAFVTTGGDEPCLLDAAGLSRAARAVAISARFRLPLLCTQDCVGYDPAAGAQLLRPMRQLVEALHASKAIKISLVTGHGHVLGDFVLGGRGAGYDLVWSWPSATIGTADVRVYEPAAVTEAAGPWDAADIGIVDDVILPSDTRPWLSRALQVLASSRAVPSTAYDRGVKLVDLT